MKNTDTVSLREAETAIDYLRSMMRSIRGLDRVEDVAKYAQHAIDHTEEISLRFGIAAPVAAIQPAGETFLVCAHGETDLPEATIVATLDDAKQAILSMIWDTAADAPDGERDEIFASIDATTEWPWEMRFEIGGVSIERVFTRAPAASAPAQPATLQRFSAYVESPLHNPYAEMEPNDDGDYVRWDEAQAAFAVPAQPEAKGDYMPFNPADINPDGNFGDTVDFAAIVVASLAAPVPAAPADKFNAATCDQIAAALLLNEVRKNQPANDEPSEIESLIACLGDDAATLTALNPDDEMAQTMRDAARYLSNIAPTDKGELPEPIGYAQKQPLLQYAPLTMLYSNKLAPEDRHECVAMYSEDQVRCILADRARQAAIAQLSGAVPIERMLAARQAVFNTVKTDEVGSALAALKIIEEYSLSVHEGSGIAGMCRDVINALTIAAAPQPPSTGSIADDAEFVHLLTEVGNASFDCGAHDDEDEDSKPYPGLVESSLKSKASLATFIDTRTAALIHAASKERGGDALDAERYREWRAATCRVDDTFVENLVNALPERLDVADGSTPTSDEWDTAMDAAIATTKAAK